MDKEKVFRYCSDIIKEEVRYKLMGWMFRRPLFKSIDEGLFFHKTIGGDIVGFCMCRILKRTNVISIDKIGVGVEYRSQGIGFNLLNKVKGLGLPIKLDVVKDNFIAVDFYKKNGFYIVGEKVLGKDLDVLIMKHD